MVTVTVRVMVTVTVMVMVDMSNFKAQLEELGRLNKKRTQGEWRRQGRFAGQYGVVITGERGPRAWKPGRFICSSRAVKNGVEAANFKNNFEFIAASANITTPMIEHIRALEEENARLRGALEKAKWFIDHVMGKEKRVDWGRTFDIDWGKVNSALLAVTQALAIKPDNETGEE